MACVGALLALWNDINPARSDEYERWHALEHVPERVWVPGFITATRYIANKSEQPRYFTLYELQSLECLETSEYRTLVNEPTPWSASMRPDITSFHRLACALVVDAGRAISPSIVVVRAVWTTSSAPNRSQLQARAAALLVNRNFTRIQIGEAAPAGEQALVNQRSAPAGRELLFLVHTLVHEDLSPLDRRLADELADLTHSSDWRECTFYRFASRVQHSDVSAAERPKPRLDLMR
jgi:hypothetical protein